MSEATPSSMFVNVLKAETVSHLRAKDGKLVDRMNVVGRDNDGRIIRATAWGTVVHDVSEVIGRGKNVELFVTTSDNGYTNIEWAEPVKKGK